TPVLAGLGLVIAMGSSLYIGRMLFLTFLGSRPWQRGPKSHAHEAPVVMWAPVLVLAAIGAAAGLFAAPLARMLGAEAPEGPRTMTLLASAFMLGGWALAWLATDGVPSWEPNWRALHPQFLEAVMSDWGWQPFCHGVARAVGAGAALLTELWEAALWDAGTEALAGAAPAAGGRLSSWNRGFLNDYAWWMTAGAALLLLTVALWR
ncbi:MAG: hypothetical protein KGL53_16855, partial [Elusimicrobia bacterium]|nr:hypothetical protein [Elusimicrobiota bacterium]